MAVRIRLQRKGRKKRPFYRVVVADSRTARDGRFIERLGYYNPLTDPAEIVINEERALNWLSRGAQPSDTAKSLLSKVGILQKFHDQKQAGKSGAEPEAEAPGTDESDQEVQAQESEATESETIDSEATDPDADSSDVS